MGLDEQKFIVKYFLTGIVHVSNLKHFYYTSVGDIVLESL